jgi:hypothetical protein
MLSNIEQAVTSLLASNEAITISNVFSAYMTIAGIRELDTDFVVATFERAMDKHAPRPTVVQSPMIVKLRNQYWYTKLGGCGNGGVMCQKCGQCGGMKHQQRTTSVPAITAPQSTRVVEKAKEAVRKGETLRVTYVLLLTSVYLQPNRRSRNVAAARQRPTHMRLLQAVLIIESRNAGLYHYSIFPHLSFKNSLVFVTHPWS